MARRFCFTRFDYTTFLCFIAYAASSMIIPMVLVLLAADMNFPLEEGGRGLGGALQLGRSFPMVASMLFCGFLAVRWGKARVLGVSLLCVGAGITACAFAPGYGILFAAIAFAGLGEGVIEGLATPFIQDQHPASPGRYINFSHAFWSVGVVLSVLVVGFLLNCGVSWRMLILGTGLFIFLPAFGYLFPDRAKRLKKGSDGVSASAVCANAWKILKHPRFWVFFSAMFLAGGGEFCLTFWAASYIRMEFAESTMLAAGIGTACFAGGMVAGRMLPGMLIPQRRLADLVIWAALGATVLSLFFPLVRSLGLFFPLLFLIGMATGPFWPSIQSYSSDRLDVDVTMLFVLLSCAGVPGCGVFTTLMGVAGDLFGMRESFYLVPFCFFFMGLLIFLEKRCSLRRERS